MSSFGIALALATSSLTVESAESFPPVSYEQFDERILKIHNEERIEMGVAPLVWSEKLATDAKDWAEHLANTHSFEHSPSGEGDADQGENLWAGTPNAFSAEEMMKAWIEEKKSFRSGPFPNVSVTHDWRDIGHYTQLIWYRTKEVGCARAANRSDEYLVCRYYPPGNWVGENPLGAAGDVAQAKNR